MYDKKKLIIIRAVLIAIGAVVGSTAMWQYFVYYPDVVRRELSIVVIVVSGAVFALLLGLSAKPIYRLGAAIVSAFSGVRYSLGARGIVAVISGLVSAGLVGFLFDVIIRRYLDIIAVRALADALVVVMFASLCCYGFIKWLTADEEVSSGATVGMPCRGYLLTASCFFDDRVFAAADFLCAVKITTATFKAVWKFGDDGALFRLKAVSESGEVETVKSATDFDDADEYTAVERKTADDKLLVPIQAKSDVFPAMDGADLASFAPPSETIIERFKAYASGATSGGKS